MDALSHLFFESPLELAILSVVMLLVAYAIWLRAESDRWRRRIWPIALALIAVLFTIQSLVVTQREELSNTLDDLIAAVGRRDPAAIRPIIAADYITDEMDRAGLMSYIEAALEHVEIHDARAGTIQTDIDGDRATMEFSITATVRAANFADRIPSRWRLHWLRTPAGWRITQIEPLEIAGNPVHGLRSLRAW